MPFIDCKFSQKLTEEKKEKIKTELGKAVSILNKPESYLMVGIADGCDLYFAGNKLANGAYVSVSLFGSAQSSACEKMTETLCSVFESELNVKGKNVYITYHGVKDWGWNGGNF
ncbi:MAG: hypothetical protein K2I30_02530 [Clostridia bacterium]|nr:hypothetical protein [Clostridia bacterium]